MGAAKMLRILGGGQGIPGYAGPRELGGGLLCKNRVGRRGQAGYRFAGIGLETVMTVSTAAGFSDDGSAEAARRLAIGFLNWAHALDHFVILIYPTVVIELAVVYGRSYATLIALST